MILEEGGLCMSPLRRKGGGMMVLLFGKCKGQDIREIPDDYCMWLAKPVYSGKFYKSLHSTELKWKVPFEVKMAARRELELRGFKLIGERWEK
jgi:hypothetical protein